MDLSIPIKDTTLYIRVAAIIETPKGFLFEVSKDGDYIFIIGGKIKINENSKKALIREIFEEIGIAVENMDLCSVIENIYTKKDKKMHEICFVYKIDLPIQDKDLPYGFIEVPLSEINKFDIRPSSVVSILNDNILFKHIIQN